jgi:carboxymethylenebutenolidase
VPKEKYEANGIKHEGYLALPPSGKGPGLLLLHAWWGLTDVFTSVADKLAAEGYVVFAPDFYDGKSTDVIAEAEKMVKANEGNFDSVMAHAAGALAHLQKHPAVTSAKLAAVGFSMGAAYAVVLDENFPDAFDRVVLFYGMAGADVSKSHARYQGHFAENDPYESTEEARKMATDKVEVHIYPGTGHWFFEDNRADAYNAEAAKLAWGRTLAFLKS